MNGPSLVPKFAEIAPEVDFHHQVAPMPQQYNSFHEYDRGDQMNMMGRDSYYDEYKPYNPSAMPHSFMNEWNFTIEKKKMNDIAENVDRFFSEIPDDFKQVVTFGKVNPLSL